jgi:peroxiredoxin
MTMKKILLFSLCLATLLNACAQNEKKYKITGKIGDYNTPAKIYLQYIENDEVITQSSDLKKGRFSFSGTIKFPSSGRLVIIPDGSPISDEKAYDNLLPLMVDNEEFNVDSQDSLQKAVISGSLINKDMDALNKQLKDISLKLDSVAQEYYNTPPEKQQNEEYTSSVMREYDTLKEKFPEIYRNYINTHPDSHLSLIILKQFGPQGFSPDEMEVLYHSLSSSVQNSDEGKLFAKTILSQKKTTIGSIAPDFTQNDTNGNPVSLSEFRGKYLLIDFWASWCGPCRKENPNVVAAYNKYKDKNFEILGVSLDNPGKKEAWLNAIRADGLTWTQVSDLKGWQNAVAVQYNVQSIPQNFLLDPNGVIIAKNLRGEELSQRLESILK